VGSRDDNLAYQRERLARLLRHAAEHVPFYRDRLASLFDGSGKIDWSRWGAVPLPTRKDMMEGGDAVRSDALPRGRGAVTRSTTSGSTGAALTGSLRP